MSGPEEPSRVPKNLGDRFIWAIEPVATILLFFAFASCTAMIGGKAWSEYEGRRRAERAYKAIVPGMTLDQASAASAQFGDILPAETPNTARVTFWVRGGVLSGNYRMVLHLDEASRITRVDAPEYEADD